jgi:16S rRNA (guanine(527)-N(7))-methyltransferase RsmG
MNGDRDNRFRLALQPVLEEFGIDALSADQLSKLSQHYAMLCSWNRRINLTRVIEPEEAARLHYAESLIGRTLVGESSTLLDIGSGAGFPAVPLAIVCPALQVTALEVNQKKSLFLKEAKDALHLSNFSVVTARVEGFPIKEYDVLASRALDRGEELLPALIDSMIQGQSAMLYTTAESLNGLSARLRQPCSIEVKRIPGSDNRLIAIIRGSRPRQSVKIT